MTRVFSIFERLGLGGGGKVKAVIRRMNVLAEMPEFFPILLNLDHSPRQKLNFAELQARGVIAPGVRQMTLPEGCLNAAIRRGIEPFDDFPRYDDIQQKGKKTNYLLEGTAVMTDRSEQTPIGRVTKRTLAADTTRRRYILIDGIVYKLVQRNDDGTVETTDFAAGVPIRWVKTREGEFVVGRNLVTGVICRMERIYLKSVYELLDLEESVVFFDGVTSAYLASATAGRRALFLHADHRSPEDVVIPRSRYLLENFKGEAIITSTHTHKSQIEADFDLAHAIRVIPHFCERSSLNGTAPRRHLVTVSRLDLEGKPIQQCISAFCLIKDAFPDVNYLIYGVGAGRNTLETLIADTDCADRVKLMGYTSDPLNVFRQAIASVYPTMTEGFGLSILEALSNGCPVISYDVNYGPREMIVSGKNGELVSPGDIAGIARAMRKLLCRPAAYQAQTDHGLHRYSRQAYVANYRDFVNDLKNPVSSG